MIRIRSNAHRGHDCLHLLVLSLALGACTHATRGGLAIDADVAVTGVSVIDVERGRAVTDQTVLIKGHRIVGVGSSRDARYAATARVVDGRGKYLIPGLWDMHAHLNPMTALRIDMPLTLAHGVTGLRVMGADRPNAAPQTTPGLNTHRWWQAQVDSGKLVGPRLLALASWAVNGNSGIADAMPAYYKAATREDGRQLARYFKESGFDFIKVYNNVSREGYLGLTEEARRLGLPFAGHEPAVMSAAEISAAGQKSIEHSRIFLFNCFPGADSMQRNLIPASARGTPLRRRMVDEYDASRCRTLFGTFARNGTWITPTHVTRRMDAFADDSAFRHDTRLKYVPYPQRMSWSIDANGMVASDASAAGRKAYMDFYRKGLSLTGEAYRAGVPVMLGTDAGDSFVFPGASVHDELEEFIKAGLTPAEALRAATLSGAAYLGRTADFGTVSAGRFADLVLLDANPLDAISNTRRIHAVLHNGRVFDRAQLDSMRSSVEAAARLTPQAELWLAAAEGDSVAALAALAAGARIDSLDGQGNRRALNYAAIYNRSAVVRTLVGHGAALNLRNGTGFTPLHHAAESGAIDALAVLLAAGADATIPSSNGKRPVETARTAGHEKAVQLLEAAARRP